MILALALWGTVGTIGDAAAPALETWPEATWAQATPEEVGLDAERLGEAVRSGARSDGSGMILRHGRLVASWGDSTRLYDLKSTTKSIGSTALWLALADRRVRLDDPARRHHPGFGVPPQANARSGWVERITLRMLANQTAGFAKPGGYEPLLFEPDTRWSYSDGGPNWLAECLTLAYGRDLEELLFERVFEPLGIRRRDLRWRPNAYRPHTIDGLPRREFGSGVHANVRAMARIGLLYLQAGRWRDHQLLSRCHVRGIPRVPSRLAALPVEKPQDYGHASAHYHWLWWNNADGAIPALPRDTFWSWGLYDSLIVVAPSLDLVAVRAGRSWPRRPGADHYAVLEPFLTPLAQAVTLQGGSPEWRVPVSPRIESVGWAPPETIIRRAQGSDNWPMTWADDGHLYTAYGDGRGFEPFVPEKLSLGLARVVGNPPAFRGVNLRAPTLERRGDGARGAKASGLLCVNGRLFLWARNVGHARLAWSDDHGRTWHWADWRFTESFGCPSFVNDGPDYAQAPSDEVYVVSPDSADAYHRADRFVLARVPRNAVTHRDRYEFFVRLNAKGRPVWSRDIAQRGAIFERQGGCYRSSMVWLGPWKRYLWCQTGPGEDPRFEGGFGLFDAPHPWGPWTEVYWTLRWDVGPGETQHLPAKWVLADGRRFWLVFSGNDAFSVRSGWFVPRPR